MGFFGAMFAALTLWLQLGWTGAGLLPPFLVFVGIVAAARTVVRMPGRGATLSERVRKVVLWSSAAEGPGILLISNIAIDLDRRDLILSGMTLVVGLHFIPIAMASKLRPYWVLGCALIATSLLSMLLPAPTSGIAAGFAAAVALTAAAVLAIRRDRHARLADAPSLAAAR